MTTEQTLQQRRRNRLWLLAIFALFFGSLLAAGGLRFAGWRPAGMKNQGELLQPPADLRHVVPQLADGGDYRWNPPARIWRIALAPPAGCSDACDTLARELDTVWRLFGRNAGRVHVLWICPSTGCVPPAGVARTQALRVLQPSPALRAGLPRVDEVTFNGRRGVPVYIIDPNGFVILRYAPGFDPAGLRADMAKLLKLM